MSSIEGETTARISPSHRKPSSCSAVHEGHVAGRSIRLYDACAYYSFCGSARPDVQDAVSSKAQRPLVSSAWFCLRPVCTKYSNWPGTWAGCLIHHHPKENSRNSSNSIPGKNVPGRDSPWYLIHLSRQNPGTSGGSSLIWRHATLQPRIHPGT